MSELKRLGRRKAFSGEIVDLYKDTVQLPDGRIEEWDYVHHKKGGGAAIVAVRKSDRKILLVRQYRPAIGQTIYELPAGGRDNPGEDTAVTAMRELKEETGYETDHVTKLSRILTAVAWCNEFTDLYLADNVVKTGTQELDEAEDIRVAAFSLSEVLSMIRDGTIEDAKTVAGICAYATFCTG